MTAFLGFDAGGSKTDCVLIESSGRVLAESTGGPANPLRQGFAKACAALGETARHALSSAHLDAGEVRAICAGMAGAGRPRIARRVASYLSRAFPQAAIRVTSDIEIALEAAFGSRHGVVVIAGTGSAACGRNAAGKVVRAGGWGSWIGDPGSAFEMGRRAVEASLRARDNLGPATILGEQILAAQQARDWDTLIERVAKHSDQVFPQLYSVLLDSESSGDTVAREILDSAVKSLVHLVRSVVEQLGFSGQPFHLAKTGGVFAHSAQFSSEFDAEVARVAPTAQIEPLQISPARAAADLAMKLRGGANARSA